MAIIGGIPYFQTNPYDAALAFPSHDLYPNCKMIYIYILYPIIKCIENAWVYTTLIHFIPSWIWFCDPQMISQLGSVTTSSWLREPSCAAATAKAAKDETSGSWPSCNISRMTPGAGPMATDVNMTWLFCGFLGRKIRKQCQHVTKWGCVKICQNPWLTW